MASLMNYETGEEIRTATDSERDESIEAARTDGGAGVITVNIDGTALKCYVID